MLQKTTLTTADAPYTLPPSATAAIIIVVSGAAEATVTPHGQPARVQQSLGAGQAWLQPAWAEVVLRATAPLLLFRTHANPPRGHGDA